MISAAQKWFSEYGDHQDAKGPVNTKAIFYIKIYFDLEIYV